MMPTSKPSSPPFQNRRASSGSSWRRKRFVRWGFFALVACGAAWAYGPARWTWSRAQQDLAVVDARRVPFVVAAGERILIVSPHLDDETLGAGGLLAHAARRKIPARVVFLSNGDGSASTILALNFQNGRRFSYVEAAALRKNEARRALRKLGLPPSAAIFLGYPDGDLRTLWDNWNGVDPIRARFSRLSQVPYADAPGFGSEFRGANLLRDLQAQIAVFRPTRVLSTHASDSHPDHWAADAFARLALQVLSARDPFFGRVRHGGFLIHHGVFPLPHGAHLNRRLGVPRSLQGLGDWRDFELGNSERESKRAALEEYTSQLVWTPHYLRAFVRRNEPLGESPNLSASPSAPARWRDEAEESHALSRRPNADIREVLVRAADGAGGLEIETVLASPPRRGDEYTVNVKGIFASGRVVARRFDVRLGHGELAAREARYAREVPRRLRPRGFTISLPLGIFGLGTPSRDDFPEWKEKPRAVVVDAASCSGAPEHGQHLDCTEARVVRLR